MKGVNRFFSSACLILASAVSLVACEKENSASGKNIYDAYFEAAKPATEVLSNQAHNLSDALMRQTSFGQAAQDAQEKQQLKRDVQTKRVMRSVRECIKPNGLIDDEVQMCVNGTREKTW